MGNATDSLAVLFIGNSYTNRNDLPALVERLALSGHPPIRLTTERVIANGMSLKTHWSRGIATGLIRTKKWDFVVLQDQSTMPLKNPARLQEYAEKFDEEIRANGTQTALYLTWARSDAPERQVDITAAYEEAARGIKAVVVPVGIAWQLALQIHPTIQLHERDKSHPTLAGTLLAAYVFYAKLLKRSPVGLPPLGIPAGEAADLQEVAWNVCLKIGK